MPRLEIPGSASLVGYLPGELLLLRLRCPANEAVNGEPYAVQLCAS